MPQLVRFYIRHVIWGFLIAAVFVAGLLWFNIANLWHLVSTSDVGILATALLLVFHGIVFSGVQFGIAIMLMGEGDDAGTRAPQGLDLGQPQPVKTRAKPGRG